MPWKTIKRDCKQSSGKKGTHVVVKKKKSGGTEQESCHTSEEKAKSAIRARYANEGRKMKITKKQLRQIIQEEQRRIISEEISKNDTAEIAKIIEELKGAVEMHKSQYERLQSILDRLEKEQS
tara:strand:+ start:27 stop:395 length:369 start_codon:yes stop_codon:yes gene_type:complete